MKKVLVILGILLLTGCSNKLVCTKKITEEEYDTQEKIIFTISSDNKITDMEETHTMIFENDSKAELYLNIFETLVDDYEIKLDGNKIRMSIKKEYGQNESSLEEIQKQMEKNGYSCQ